MDVLDTLDCRPKTRGDHVDSRCPAHEDGSPSLSVDWRAGDADAGGRVLAMCHAGCATDDVVAALGLDWTDLYDDPPTRPASGVRPGSVGRRTARTPDTRHQPRPVRGTVPVVPTPATRPAGAPPAPAAPAPRLRKVAEYLYCDEAGKVVGWMVRFQPKTFRWQRAGDTGRREWGAPERRPLYRLPDVLAAVAGGVPVFVVEGERDADALAAAGVVATCNPEGAGKWRSEHTAALAGARVVLVADRDVPGYRHAAAVRAELETAGAAVDLVAAAAGKDAADHLAAGRAVAELVPVPADELTAALTDPSAAASSTAAPAPAKPAGGAGPDGEPAPAPAVDLERERRRRRGGSGDGGAGEEAPAVPQYRIPMSQGAWRYSTGDGDGFARGVYRRAGRGDEDESTADGWALVAPLPYVWERLSRRDGIGRRAAVDYRLSMQPSGTDGAEVAVCDTDEVKGGEWADRLAVALSADDKVARAAATAIRHVAYRSAPERESVPRWHEGVLELPPADVGPAGYGEVAGDEPAARQAWQEVAGIVSRHPKLALSVGVALGGPFVSPCRRRPFIYLMVGGSSQGKSTALNVGGALYGYIEREPGGGTVTRSWNTSAIGLTTSLGNLAVLPAFRDELSSSGLNPAALETVLMRLVQGASRDVAKRTSGQRISPEWRSPLLATGNVGVLGRIANEGVAARVIEVQTPIVGTRPDDPAAAADAERVEELVLEHYGWPLRWLTAAAPALVDVQAAIERAEADLDMAGGGVARRLDKHLALGVVGAELFDTLTGADTPTRPAALAAARTVLADLVAELAERGANPAVRLLAAVAEATVSRPAAYPSELEYARALAGVEGARWLARDVEGFTLETAGGGREVAVLTGHLDKIAAGAKIEDTLPGLRQLRDQHKLDASGESEGRLTKRVRINGTKHRPRCYVFRFPPEDAGDDDPNRPALTLPVVTDPSSSGAGDVDQVPVDQVPVDQVPVDHATASRPVTEGSDDDVEPDFDAGGRLVRAELAPCELCGLPVPYRTAGRPLHPYGGCRPQPTPPAPVVDPPAAPRPAPVSAVHEPDAEPPAPPAGVSELGGRFRAAVLDVSRRGRAVRATLTAVEPGAAPEVVDVPAGAAGIAALAVTRDLSDLWVTRRSLGPLELADVPAFARSTTVHPHPWAQPPADAGVTVRAGGLTPWTALDVEGRPRPVNVGWVGWMASRSPLQELDGPGLARVLGTFAGAVGEPFRHSAAATAGNLLAREAGAVRAGGRVRGRKARLVPCQAVLADEVPRADRGGWTLAPVGWERALTDAEAAQPYTRKWDGNVAYLAAYGTPVGLGEPERRQGGEFSPKLAGYNRVDAARLVVPHPLMPAWNDHREDDGTVWLTTPEYGMLVRLAIAPPILESVVWPDSSRLLDTLAVRLRDARRELIGDRTDPAEMAEFKKSDPVGYAAYKLGNSIHQIAANYVANPERRAEDDRYGKALYRPDWRDMWVSHVRCAHYVRMARAGVESGRWPVFVNEDAVAYTTGELDPAAALPAGLVYGLGGGQYKPEGTADTAQLLARRKRPDRGFLPAFDAAKIGG